MELFSYFRSSAAYRVRLALNYKAIPHTLVPVNLLQKQHQANAYKQLNPQGLVPALRLEDGTVLTQSLVIIEWLEEHYPEPCLLPELSSERAQCRALAHSIAMEIHPLNNLRVLTYLEHDLSIDAVQKKQWYAHWIQQGFEALEPQLMAAPYALGEQVSMVDICLIPQVFNALRFHVPLDRYKKIREVYEACNQLQPFIDASPDQQPDALH